MTRAQSWYSARILLESVHEPDDPGDALFEDKVILIRATSERDAKARAVKFGRAEEHEYLNAYGKTVRWTFREILDIAPLYDDVLSEGSEVYSQLIGENDLKAIRRTLSPERVLSLSD